MANDLVSANVAYLSAKEKMSENLSSVQIARTLDSLLFKSIAPLMLHSQHVEYTLVELLYHIFHNMRRKFSNRSHDDLRNTLFTLIVTKKKTGKAAELRRLSLERSIYFKILLVFEVDAAHYVADTPEALRTGQKTERMRDIERRYRAEGHPGFYTACTNALFWGPRAVEFRNMVADKFRRLAYVEAHKASANTGLQISTNDLARNMFLSVLKAIDKFDPDKGPLASYVLWWFRDAENGDSGHEEGVAYTIPLAKRKELLADGVVNIYVPLDSGTEYGADDAPSVLDRLSEETEGQVLQNLICRANTDKVFSLLNHVIFTLTESERQRLRDTVRL